MERDEDLTAPYAFKDKMWIAFEDRISLSIKVGTFHFYYLVLVLSILIDSFATNCSFSFLRENMYCFEIFLDWLCIT